MTSPRGGRPEEGTPEYDWLYGSKPEAGNNPSPEQAADATRMMPTEPRGAAPGPRDDATRVSPRVAADADQGRRSARYVEPERTRSSASGQQSSQQPSLTKQSPAGPGGPAAPGGPGGPGGPGEPPRRSGGRGPRMPWPLRRMFRPKLRWILYALVLWIVYLVAVPFLAWQEVGAIDAMPADKGRPADQGGTTYLVVGSDSRKGLTKAERKKLGTGGDVGQRTDTIMLLHSGDGPTTLTSLPRDSRVEIPGHGVSKINAAFAWGGPKLLVKTVEQNTGIRIDHYVEIGMGGVVQAVDAVGGIEICPKEDMKDPLANLDIKKGCQEVDGATALAYSRSRHTHANGDIGRAEAQREVVGQVAHKAVSPMSVVNPVRYWKLWETASGILRVDDETGVVGAGKFALAMTGADQTCMVPLQDLAVTWDPVRSQKYFKYIIDDDLSNMPKNLCTVTGFAE